MGLVYQADALNTPWMRSGRIDGIYTLIHANLKALRLSKAMSHNEMKPQICSIHKREEGGDQ